MEKLSQLIEQYGRWSGLKDYIQRIDTYIKSDFSLAMENAKSLLETICKEICKSKGSAIENNLSINKVLKKAFTVMGYSNSEPAVQISSALATIGQQIGNLRNKIGSTSHGETMEELKERNDKVDEMTRDLIIDTTETIAIFLIRAFENDNCIKNTKNRISYNDNPDFNDYLDDTFGEFAISIYSYSASEILFYVDYDAYLAELEAFEEVER